ncbi:hypothetical protein [uncultured Oscillibacter sp.]|uniref:hypothetical protein n=1 Tax=uncultured Oscillibacter sp. TaxID=876091 RepID=UPI0026294860|nr:hypothetical protein [uncultured Oscillibacter sp.]
MAEMDRLMGMKLGDTKADAAALRILRRQFSNIPRSVVKNRIAGHEGVYSCDGGIDGRKLLVKLEKQLAQANIRVELYEEWTGGDGARKTVPLSQEYLYHSLHRYVEISRQVDRETDNESAE